MIVEAEIKANPLLDLTSKQREVLDLLIQHKTSKEISRILGISPHTVDQRIMLARAKLNVASRSEIAQAYRRLIEIYEQPVYGLSHVGFPPLPDHVPVREGVNVLTKPEPDPTAASLPGIERFEVRRSSEAYYHVLPEMFDGPHGTLMRLGYIAVITVFLILIVMGGLTMFAQLSSMLDR